MVASAPVHRMAVGRGDVEDHRTRKSTALCPMYPELNIILYQRDVRIIEHEGNNFTEVEGKAEV